jgi:hypothetical protein
MTEAKSSYSSGNLSDARFAMEQMLHDIDMEIGKQILLLLPEKVNGLTANAKNDNVNGMASGFASGLYVSRTYGVENKTASIDIINNSPMINSINAMLSLPFIGRSSDANQKVVKVQGYKSILNKTVNNKDKISYELQVPFNNTLMTFKVDDINETDFLKAADSIPIACKYIKSYLIISLMLFF